MTKKQEEEEFKLFQISFSQKYGRAFNAVYAEDNMIWSGWLARAEHEYKQQ